jgi:hypothetical protein
MAFLFCISVSSFCFSHMMIASYFSIITNVFVAVKYFISKLSVVTCLLVCMYYRPTGGRRYTGLRYLRFYFSVVRDSRILSVATVESAAQAHRVLVTQPVKNYELRPFAVCHSENPRACYTFIHLCFFVIRGDSLERNPRV